jgi:hypothetical protein
MEECRAKPLVRETPVFMRLRRTLPMVTMRLSGHQSQWKNAGFPQFSWVFMPEMPIFACFWPVGPQKPATGAGLAIKQRWSC